MILILNHMYEGKIMEKVIEFNIKRNDLKEYLEECLREENIEYEIKIEDRWIQRYKNASKYYQVYSLYVNNSSLNKVKQFIEDFNNAEVVTENIEELKNAEEETDNKFKIFTMKNFLKYYWCAIILMGLLIIIFISVRGLV